MKKVIGTLLLVIALVAGLLAAWRIGVLGVADVAAEDSVQHVRTDYAQDPVLQLDQARTLLADGHVAAARATAQSVLRRDPLQSGALVLLARAADADNADDAGDLFAIALRRAPRNQYARAWMIGSHLQRGQYAAALDNLDTLLRFAPRRQQDFLPIVVQYADRPAFAAALAQTLQAHPPWRGSLLADLLRDGGYRAVDSVYGKLQEAGDLAHDEEGAWLQRLQQAGLWGEAYSRWASGLHLTPGTTLALVHNGGFEQPISGGGFGWRSHSTPGVLIGRVRMRGNVALRVRFLGRRVTRTGLEQTLLLAPGSYRLEFSARARNLRSDKGLQWALTCRGKNPMQAASPRLQGSFDWKPLQFDFTVPADDCPAQLLALVNPGAGGTGKLVSGNLWFDDFSLQPLRTPSQATPRTP